MIKELATRTPSVCAQSDKQREYQAFFNKKLDEWDASSPADLSVEERKKFFNEIEKEWDG